MASSRVCVLDHRDLTVLVGRFPEIGVGMLRAVGFKLASAERMVTSHTSAEVGARIATYLLDCPARRDASGRPKVGLLLAKKEVARFMGTTTQMLSRRLAERDGLIRLLPGRDELILDAAGRRIGLASDKGGLDLRQGVRPGPLLAWEQRQLKEKDLTMWSTITSGWKRLSGLIVQTASAHCDTEDGPAVTDGRRALETGNINHALKWVGAAHEDEVRAVFDKAVRVRALGGEVAELADRLFLETLVRIHRAGEGEGFTGIEPAGTPLPPAVVAADRAIADGSLEPLRGLISPDRWPELQHRFDRAMARRGFDLDDLDAARAYIEANVMFVTYAEGEDGHGHDGHEAHHHGH